MKRMPGTFKDIPPNLTVHRVDIGKGIVQHVGACNSTVLVPPANSTAYVIVCEGVQANTPDSIVCERLMADGSRAVIGKAFHAKQLTEISQTVSLAYKAQWLDPFYDIRCAFDGASAMYMDVYKDRDIRGTELRVYDARVSAAVAAPHDPDLAAHAVIVCYEQVRFVPNEAFLGKIRALYTAARRAATETQVKFDQLFPVGAGTKPSSWFW